MSYLINGAADTLLSAASFTLTGTPTVIPSVASAKVSFRLVFEQDPEAIRAAFREFVRARVAEG